MFSHKLPSLRPNDTPITVTNRHRCLFFYYSFFFLLALYPFTITTASAQGFGMGYGNSMGSGFGGINGSMNNIAGIGANLNNAGGYAGTSQAAIDSAIFHGNQQMQRSDIDFEDYVLRKRSAFVLQMQQNDQAEEKLRAYAEQRLKVLTLAKTGKTRVSLNASQQAEAHDLMDWLKKDAEQRANNLAYLKRQDQAVAGLEQDEMISFKNQRNSLHNMFEDNLAVQSQYKWNQQMQLANLHLTQNRQGAVSWGRPPQDGLSNIGGYGGGSGRRWGY